MRYVVKAMRAGQEVVTLPLEAADETDARQQAKGQGLVVLSVKPERALQALQWRRERFPLNLFSQELISLLDAGLILVESLETLAEKEGHGPTASVLRQILEHLYQGRTFSFALEKFPGVFPPLYVATVRASERTGDLKEALARYLEYASQMEKVRRKLVSASIYPALLLGVGGLVTLFLLVYVVPRFSRIYDDAGRNLPLLSKLLIDWGKLMEANATLVLTSLALAAVLAVWGLSRPEFRRWLGPKLWAMPAIGERLRIYQLARFYRTLGMLLKSGIPLVRALDMAGGLLSPALRVSMQRAAERIAEGQAISQAAELEGLTTPVALRMLRVGERSGQLGPMSERIALFYEEEMAQWVDTFTRLFEPLLMAAIGIVIGLVVLLLYLPIFELAGSIE